MAGPPHDIVTAAPVRLGGIAAGGAVTVALPLTFPDDGGPTAFDRAVADPIHTALDAHRGVLHALALPSNGYALVPVLILVCGWFVVRGELRRAAVMLAVPELVLALNTLLWKPLWHRQLHDYPAYPSGHTVHLVAIATTLIVLLASTRARLITLGVATMAFTAAAIGMIGLDYHLPTDILGGAGAAVAMVFALCWAASPLVAHRNLGDNRKRW